MRLRPGLILAVVAGALWLSSAEAAATLLPPPGGDTPIAYVALGDSYSAGEGLSPFLAGTATSSDRCHRSPRSYPEFERSLLGVTTFHDYACSGATTVNIDASTQYAPERLPQADQAPLSTANLVTLTIGGNDIDFSGKLEYCALHHSCDDNAGFTNSVSQAIGLLPSELSAAYRAIRARINSHATVVVLGYPQLFPERSAAQHCFRLHGFGVSLFDDGEQNYFNHEADIIDGVIGRAAAAEGFYYASAIATFRGHAQCDPDPYLNGITAPNHSISAGDGSFHPDTAGQQAYASLLLNFLVTRPGPRNSAGLPIDPPPTS
jgi:lysophospholipase L1-like esterase